LHGRDEARATNRLGSGDERQPFGDGANAHQLRAQSFGGQLRETGKSWRGVKAAIEAEISSHAQSCAQSITITQHYSFYTAGRFEAGPVRLPLPRSGPAGATRPVFLLLAPLHAAIGSCV
jgi:hypothetical protein